MAAANPALEEITGYLGVGSLLLLSGFFVLDGLFDFVLFVEEYTKSSAWAVLVTVPILVISYVLGLFSSLGTEALLSLIFGQLLTPVRFALVATLNNESLSKRYADVERHSRLLNGCALAFALLGIGSWFEVRQMGQFGVVGQIGLYLGLLTAIGCPFLARHVQTELLRVVDAVDTVNAS